MARPTTGALPTTSIPTGTHTKWRNATPTRNAQGTKQVHERRQKGSLCGAEALEGDPQVPGAEKCQTNSHGVDPSAQTGPRR